MLPEDREPPAPAPPAPPGTALARAFDRFVSDGPLFSRRVSNILGGLLLAAALVALVLVTQKVRTTPAPPHLEPTADGDEMRFGLSLEKRKALFAELAAADPEWRKKAASRFHEAWRREDDRAAMERDHVRTMARRVGVTVTVAYLVVDEGLRLHWTAPNGSPLNAAVVPLQKK